MQLHPGQWRKVSPFWGKKLGIAHLSSKVLYHAVCYLKRWRKWYWEQKLWIPVTQRHTIRSHAFQSSQLNWICHLTQNHRHTSNSLVLQFYLLCPPVEAFVAHLFSLSSSMDSLWEVTDFELLEWGLPGSAVIFNPMQRQECFSQCLKPSMPLIPVKI